MKHLKSYRHCLAMLGIVLVGLFPSKARAQIPVVKDGESIAFLGDSITQFGVSNPGGYVNLVMNGLETCGIKAVMIPAGVAGNTSQDMLARLDKDVLSKKPIWMTLSCGVNDVWHTTGGIPLDKYKENIIAIVDRAQAAGIKVMILTATMIHEDQPNGSNQRLLAYNDFLRSLASEKKCLLADLNADMQKEVSSTPHQGNLLTVDGVHMNIDGNIMMASGVLRAFGVNDAQMQQIQGKWLDLPNGVELAGKTTITLRQYHQLQILAKEQKQTVQTLITQKFGEAIAPLVKPELQK